MENEENLQEEQKHACNCNKHKKIFLIILMILTAASLAVSVLANYKISLVLNTLQASGMSVVNNEPIQQPADFLISEKYDKGQSYDKALKKNKPVLMFFYVDWCGFCKKFAPIFAKLATNNKLNKDFAFAYINCEDSKNADLVAEYKIEGYPSVFVSNSKTNIREAIPNEILFENEDKLIEKILTFKE